MNRTLPGYVEYPIANSGERHLILTSSVFSLGTSHTWSHRKDSVRWKLQKFHGTTSWEVYSAQLKLLGEANDWTSEECTEELAMSLKCSALKTPATLVKRGAVLLPDFGGSAAETGQHLPSKRNLPSQVQD